MNSANKLRPTARFVAVQALLRVERDRAFAIPALDAELTRYPQLSERDRALATELTYGVLRTRGGLLRELERHAPRGISDEILRTELLVAAYQLRFLDRVPAYAAVNEAVEAVRVVRGARVAGFANAVLRKLKNSSLDYAAAVKATVPDWLQSALSESTSEADTSALLGLDTHGGPASPPLTVRVRADRPHPSWTGELTAAEFAPHAFHLDRRGDPRRLPGYAEGHFVVQEEGAQLIAHALGARSGDKVWDACAGHGQKASLVAELMQGSGELWVTDRYPNKLTRLNAEFQRLGLPLPHSCAVDLSQGTGDVPGDFDRILVDAPCTGIGTLRRRPELVTRLSPADPARLAQLGALIVRNAATRLRPSGRLVFAVCSVLRQECEEVLESLADVLEPAPFDASLDLFQGRSALRLLPSVHGTDGYFVASLRLVTQSGHAP